MEINIYVGDTQHFRSLSSTSHGLLGSFRDRPVTDRNFIFIDVGSGRLTGVQLDAMEQSGQSSNSWKKI